MLILLIIITIFIKELQWTKIYNIFLVNLTFIKEKSYPYEYEYIFYFTFMKAKFYLYEYEHVFEDRRYRWTPFHRSNISIACSRDDTSCFYRDLASIDTLRPLIISSPAPRMVENGNFHKLGRVHEIWSLWYFQCMEIVHSSNESSWWLE